MENKNVFVAIALSMAVLLFWGAFFETPKSVDENLQQQNVNETTKDNNISPSINEALEVKSITREDSINKVERIKIENDSIIGSISLRGGLIDDVSFKKHKQNLKDKKNVIFLNPQETEKGYFIETGWTSIGNKIKVPNTNSIWEVVGNNILNENKAIILK